jgi:multiple sugar transport system permease protein
VSAVASRDAARPARRARPGRRVLRSIGAHSALILGAVVFGFPFFWMVSTAFKNGPETIGLPPQLLPGELRWVNFSLAISFAGLWTGFRNSALLVAISLVGELLVDSMVAYSFARLRWPGRNICFVLMLATMMLPSAVTMVPLFIVFKQLGWINTYLPLVVPAFLGHPFYIFLLRQFYTTIPRELEDAARIDGASIPQIFSRIMLPLVGPALAAVGIFTFRATWNDFMGPLIYLDSPHLRTMALALWSFRQESGTEWNMLMAASTMMTLPMIAIFFLFQRYFTQGITLTGIKG